MRTLFISNIVPWPLDAGNKIRAYYLLRAIAKISDVTLVCFTYTEEEKKEVEVLRPFVREIFTISRETCHYRKIERAPWPLGVLKNLLGYCHPTQPVSVQAWDSPEGEALIRDLSRRRFDWVWAAQLGSVRYLPFFDNSRRVLDMYDIEHRKLRHRLSSKTLYKAMPFDCMEFVKLRRFERGLTRLPYELVVCSEVDKQALGGGRNVWVVPNGIELPSACPPPEPSTSDPVIMFVGMMTYQPNVDAVLHFARKIFPIIRRAIPASRFVIVGRNPTEAVKSLHDGKAITVTGAVPSVQPWLSQASVVVVPIRFGGGTRLKILEAMAHRRPVIATTVGAEGIGAESGTHLLLADDPTAFANACLLVLRDSHLRDRLTREAYQLVSEKYQWTQIARQVQGLLRADVSSRRDGGCRVNA